MSLASAEDAATVLEQFCLDVANVPAETAHLLEEVAAKDAEIVQCRETITEKDNILQKHVRSSFLGDGPLTKHPKEDAFTKIITANYDRIQALQNDKTALASKTLLVLERQLKRLDVKIRDLQLNDQFPHDPTLPSLLVNSAHNDVLAAGTPGTNPALVSAQLGGAPNIANAAVARVANSAAARNLSPVVGNALLSPPAVSPRSPRDPSAETSKRRRLNSTALSASIPAQSSNLRQSSLGPGTPKSGTPVPASRANSAQPPRPLAARKGSTLKKLPPHLAADAAATAGANSAPPGKDSARKRRSIAPSKKGDRRRLLARGASGSPSPSQDSTSPSPSRNAKTSQTGPESDDDANDSNNEEDDEDEADANDTTEIDATSLAASRANGTASFANVNAAPGTLLGTGEDEDTQVYCLCQRISFGNMVACDNENCATQWYHWGCVGLLAEPKGEWLCPDCRLLPPEEITRA